MTREQLEIRISGFGGQGVILIGHILGQAAAIHDRRYATMTQNYGPEARGSACRADLIISGEPVDYPYVTRPEVMIALSQGGYTANRASLAPGGVLIYEADMVQPEADDVEPGRGGIISAGIPATALAAQHGGKIMTNMVMVGFTAALTELVSWEALVKSVEHSVPEGTQIKNIAAAEAGFKFGQQWLAGHCGNNGGSVVERAGLLYRLG